MIPETQRPTRWVPWLSQWTSLKGSQIAAHGRVTYRDPINSVRWPGRAKSPGDIKFQGEYHCGRNNTEKPRSLWESSLCASSLEQFTSKKLERKTGNGFEADDHKNICFKFPVMLQTHYSGRMNRTEPLSKRNSVSVLRSAGLVSTYWNWRKKSRLEPQVSRRSSRGRCL